METTFLGNNEFIKHGGQLFLKTEESCFAFYNIEWAKKSYPVIMLSFKMEGCPMTSPMMFLRKLRITYYVFVCNIT